MSGFGVCPLDGSQGGMVSRWPLLQSLLHFLNCEFQFPLVLRCLSGPFPHPGANPFYWRWFLEVQSTFWWVYQIMTSPLGPGSLLHPSYLELSSGSSCLPPTHCYIFLLIHLALWKSLLLLLKPEPFFLFNLPLSSPTQDSPSLWLQELFCSPF